MPAECGVFLIYSYASFFKYSPTGVFLHVLLWKRSSINNVLGYTKIKHKTIIKLTVIQFAKAK